MEGISTHRDKGPHHHWTLTPSDEKNSYARASGLKYKEPRNNPRSRFDMPSFLTVDDGGNKRQSEFILSYPVFPVWFSSVPTHCGPRVGHSTPAIVSAFCMHIFIGLLLPLNRIQISQEITTRDFNNRLIDSITLIQSQLCLVLLTLHLPQGHSHALHHRCQCS